MDAHIAWNEQGNTLRAKGRAGEAIPCYEQAIRIAPDAAALYCNLGAAFLDLRRLQEARASFEKARDLDLKLVAARANLATVLLQQGELPGAWEEYIEASRLAPDFLYPCVQALTLSRVLRRWEHWDALMQRLRQARPKPGNSAPQMDLLYLPLEEGELFLHAQAYAAELAAADVASVSRRPPGAAEARIRVGYVSDELRRHAVGSLMADVLEQHDRRRFEVHVFAWGAGDHGLIERRVRQSTSWHDISAMPDGAAAVQIAQAGIDILIDLKGYVPGARPAIFRQRPAAVQVNWLGFPGTLGTSTYDYLLADPVVIPAGSEPFYSEMPARLPRCYQPNDRRRPLPAARSRLHHGLPEAGTVLCYLGKSSKVLPPMWRDWMAVLAAAPDSVLWVLAENDTIRLAYQSEAQACGIRADRLRFCGPAPMPEHIARFRAADLMLDSYPYGSHTTASEALWAGCPVLTLVGPGFAARVAASLLHAVELPELVAHTRQQFLEIGTQLASDPERLRLMRQRLESRRLALPLFDTPAFVRDLETLYVQMHERARRGLPAAALGASAVDFS